MKVAIVGAGISGLATARLLDAQHEVTVFEAGAYAGGHTNTITVESEVARHEVDTGFIVFNDRNYPNFERLLGELGVASQPSDMSFGVTDAGGDFEYASTSPNGLFANRGHLAAPAFYRMIADVPRFQRAARALLASGEEPSLREWLGGLGLSEQFVERVIVPQAAAVWSAEPAMMWRFPARFLVEFFANHGMLSLRGRPSWRVVQGGSRAYVRKLVAPFGERLRLATPVVEVRRLDDGGVAVTPQGCAPERFDEVVLALHADQALRVLSDASALEREVLGAFPYRANEAVLHTDERLLPRRRRAWASWNYHLRDDASGPPAVTYHMNRLQSLRADREFCVTLNRTGAIDPAAIIRTIAYAHPVYTLEGAAAQRRHGEVSGRDRVHFCGAYWGWGFHEDGVRSALRVAQRFGVAERPWAVAA